VSRGRSGRTIAVSVGDSDERRARIGGVVAGMMIAE
jgi:hypothetical protein